jgi:hypothetical protein
MTAHTFVLGASALPPSLAFLLPFPDFARPSHVYTTLKLCYLPSRTTSILTKDKYSLWTTLFR